MEATEHIDLWHRDSGSTAGGVIMTGREGRHATLSLEAPDLQLALEASGRDFFDALQQLRLQLELNRAGESGGSDVPPALRSQVAG